MSSSSWLMAGYPADDAPSPAEQERQSAKHKLDNFYFAMRNASVEAARNVEKLTDGAHELLACLDANQHATKDEFEAKQIAL